MKGDSKHIDVVVNLFFGFHRTEIIAKNVNKSESVSKYKTIGT